MITGPRVVYIPHSMKCTDCPKEDCTECNFARREIVHEEDRKGEA